LESQSGVASPENLEETPAQSETGAESESEEGKPKEGQSEDHSEPYYLKDGVPTVSLKVKGETIELPWDRVKGIAQKNILAENRLRQAAEAERNLVNREEIVVQRERELESKSLTHPPKSGVADNVDLSDLLDETTAALFDGEKEDARAKLEKLISAIRVPTGLDPAQLDKQIQQKATDTAISVLREEKAAEQEKTLNSALRDGLEQLTKQFPQVMQDDVLFSLVDRRTQDLTDLHPDWTPQQVMLTAGKEIQDLTGSGTGIPQVANSPERQARKEDLRVVPANRVSATKQPPPDAPEVDTSPAGVIARMKADRGAVAGQG
jgi:hypothetical protein